MTPTTHAPEPWLRPPMVVKVGGSLFNWPELKQRLQQYVATLAGKTVVLIPGGGKAADVVRDLDRTHGLGEEPAHWLALHALTVNAHFLSELLSGVRVVEGLNASRSAWRRGGLTVLDPFRFARGDESRPDHLPHAWDATSDSLAARVARVAEAERLILLKSASMPSGCDWAAAAKSGYVDPLFPAAVSGAAFTVDAINLCEWRPPA